MSGIGGYEAARIERAIAELMRPSPGCVEVDPYVVIARLTMAAVEHISSVNHAGVTLVGRKKIVRSLAATDGYPLVLDNIQRRSLEGPCYESAGGHQVIRVDDLATESRWPIFVERALVATPIRAFLTLPLFSNPRGRATLNLHSNRSRALDADAESAGALFAEHAARLLKVGRAPRPHRRRHSDVDTGEPVDRTPSIHGGDGSQTRGQRPIHRADESVAHAVPTANSVGANRSV